MTSGTTGVDEPEQVAVRAQAGSGNNWLTRLGQAQELVMALIGVGLAIFFAVYSPAFGSTSNGPTLSAYVAPIMFFAVAEVFVLTLGEIDLSVGQVYVLSPFLVVYLNDAGVPLIISILLALLISGLIGWLNGMITVRLRVPSFITTLGTVFALKGVVLLSSNATQINPAGIGGVADVLGGWSYSEIIWALLVAVVCHVIFRRTVFGLHITAVGGNQVASGEAGVKVGRVKIWCFILCAFLGGVIGVLDGYHIGSLNPGTDGLSLMFYGVAAAVVGGTALTGGRGTMVGAAIGALVLGILEDGFNIIGVNAFAYQLVLGMAILGAMILNIQLERIRAGRASVRRGSFASAVLRVGGAGGRRS